MGEQENRQTIERLRESFATGDMKRLYEYYHEDCVQEWPQSGERIRGKATILAIEENYPGTPRGELKSATVVGDLGVAHAVLDYGDGKPVYMCAVVEFKDGKVMKETDYFAYPFEAPEWRAQWVEKMEPARVGS